MKEGFRFVKLPKPLEQKIFIFLLGAVAFSIPFKASFNSLFSILLLTYWLVFLPKKFNLNQAKAIGLLSTLFWLAVLGMIHTQNFEEGLFRFQQKSLLLALPLIFISTNLEWQSQLPKVISIFIIGVITACLICLTVATSSWLVTHSTQHFFSQDLLETSIVDLYTYILALLCFACIILLAESYLGKLTLSGIFEKQSVKAIFISFFILFILLLSVKQIILALVLLLFAYTIRINKRFNFLFLISGLAIIISAIYFIPALKARVQEAIAEQAKENPLDQNPEHGTALNGVALRRALWVCAWDIIQQHLWLGVGSGDGQDELQAAYEKREFVFAARYNRYNAHNQYLQVGINFGLVGLLIWLASFVWLALLYKHNWIFLCLIALFMISMLTESLLETNKGALSMSFLLSLFSINFNTALRKEECYA